MPDNFFEKVYAAVQKIPCGMVATYGQVARLCGSPRSARAVGYALHLNPLPGVVPCHRVVNREGRLAPAFAFGGQGVQKELLERGACPANCVMVCIMLTFPPMVGALKPYKIGCFIVLCVT